MKPKKSSTVAINIVDSSHVKPLLEKIIALNPKLRSTMDTQNWRLKWIKPNYDDQELLDYLNKDSKRVINRYPNAKILGHKEVFSKMISFAQLVYPEDYDFLPPSFDLPSIKEHERLQAYMKAHPRATYIAKP